MGDRSPFGHGDCDGNARRRPMSPIVPRTEDCLSPRIADAKKAKTSAESLMEMGEVIRSETVHDQRSPSTMAYLRRILLLAVLPLALLAIGIVLFYPRPVTIIVKTLTDTSEGIQAPFSGLDGQSAFNITHTLECHIANPNLYPVTVRQLRLDGRWSLAGHQVTFAKQEAPDIRLDLRRTSPIMIPYDVELVADPTAGSFFLSLLARCSARDRESRTIQLDYTLNVEISYLGVRRGHQLEYSYRSPCPLGPSQIKDLLSAAGIDPATLPREVSANLA